MQDGFIGLSLYFMDFLQLFLFLHEILHEFVRILHEPKCYIIEVISMQAKTIHHFR